MRSIAMVNTLRPGVSYCRPGDRTIFLDVPTDRYFCLGREAERAFMDLQANPECRAVDYPALRRAVEDGLIRDDASGSAMSACVPPPTARTSCFDTVGSATVIQTILMGARLAAAGLALRTQPLHRTLDRFDRRKESIACDHFDDDRRGEVGAALRRCGALVTPLDRCLPRSIATAHRLLDRQVRPTLVFGVKLGPFEAHAWVQHDDVVINDVVDNVRRFTPILVR